MLEFPTLKNNPCVLLRFWGLRKTACRNVIDAALTAGCVHFDCASLYRNEEFVGNALSELLLKRAILGADVSAPPPPVDYLHLTFTQPRGGRWKNPE